MTLQVDRCPVLCEKPVVDETCTLSADVPQLYPECAITRAMAKKAERESHSDVTDVQGDTDGDMTLSEIVYSDWCEPLNVPNPTTTAFLLPELVKGVNFKLPNGRGELIEAQKSDKVWLDYITRHCHLRRQTRYMCVTL